MRRFISVTSIVFLLTACGGSGGGEATALCTNQYWDGVVGTCLPKGWTVMAREVLDQRGVLDSDVHVAFQAETAVSGLLPTVVITKEPLAAEVDSASYSDASIRSVTALPGYKLLDTRVASIDSANVGVHIYTVKPDSEEPERRFYQVSAVANSVGYTSTATVPVSVNDALQREILAILQSLTFIDPATKPAEE